VTRYDATRTDLAELLTGHPRYRIDQVWEGLHHQLAEPAEITSIPLTLRDRLSEALPAALTVARESTADAGDTVKWAWTLADGHGVESVLMHYPDRSTVCVSSQAGCAMACGFCATGQAGFARHLGAGEIVEQVVRASRRAKEDGKRLANVVFMGMGEPLANYDATWAAIHRIHDDLGIGARHITISTVGVVPGILRLAEADLPVNLAVSLHAATDDLRTELVPLNRRYPLAVLADACRHHVRSTGRRISLEWALIDGVNDTPDQASHLAAYARDLRAHINLIPLNPTPGWPTRGTPPEGIEDFLRRLAAAGANVTVRQTRGTEIDAACGQLAAAAGGPVTGAAVTLAAPAIRTRR